MSNLFGENTGLPLRGPLRAQPYQQSEGPDNLSASGPLESDAPAAAPDGGGNHGPRRGKPPSAKTLAIRRAIEALGGPDAADAGLVAARVREQDGLDVTNQDVANQRLALRKQNAEAHEPQTPPEPPAAQAAPLTAADVSLTAADLRAFVDLVKRLGVEKLRALLELAEALC